MVEFGTYYPQYNVSFTAGDVFRVSVESGVVKYKKNGVVYHTSPSIVTYPLKVDTALYTVNSTLTNAVVGGNWSGGSSGGGSSASEVLWLVADHLGTPRMILDQTGALANIKRHDYLPFGEELFAGTGGRTQQQGYTASDNVRQKFTQKERDVETNLDYFLARYYSSTQGRFTSVDPEGAGAKPDDPQSWNGYAYARNNPLLYTDPDGREYTVCDPNGKNCVKYSDREFEKLKKGGPADGYTFKNGNIYYKGELTGTYSNDCLYCGQLINEMGRRSSAIEKGTLAFAVVGVVGGATGGVGLHYLTPYLAPTVTTLGLQVPARILQFSGSTALKGLLSEVVSEINAAGAVTMGQRALAFEKILAQKGWTAHLLRLTADEVVFRSGKTNLTVTILKDGSIKIADAAGKIIAKIK